MKSSPYIRAPDSFWLRLSNASTSLEVTPFESMYGVTDENLCYYNGILLGLAASGANNGLLIDLLPKLELQRSYPWPSDTQFQESLTSLLHQEQQWNLVCEKDCDQTPVPEVHGLSLLLSKLAEACAYSKGEANACPTFAASSSSVNGRADG